MKSAKKIIVLLCFFTLLTSCSKGQKKDVKENIKNELNLKTISLKGKTFLYNYVDYQYEVSFKSENQLHWKCIKGNELGREEDEHYKLQRINDYTLFISWVEKDGLGVSQVINLREYKVNSYLKIDKEIMPLMGTIKEL
ncbi:phenolic acid decarboxylase [Polaribacter sp. L3A8]|uniref:phenolic acid decarboxylase n=1 Tax=Polaribacter sp. L3A8 TaxID=2686361 RepID=UPI00131D5C58|nr:phenolic acid decarboxylase [Polaribacter sp. L3A8]